ncbi:aminopeptidase N [Crotalus adamanteus]|uniref:Aminopeptidase N n=1 Tax=Crotalus adamanteus TaxID=8729 RepID=A0AAW1AWH2_CROAD
MAKGFFISKSLGVVGLVLGLGAVATIIALSVVYSQEKQRADDLSSQVPSSTSAAVTPGTTIAGTAQATTANGTAQATTTKPLEPWDHMRLPKTLMPTFYNISLQPFLTEVAPNLYIFKGNSTVDFQCKQPTDLILIHSKKLNYTLQGAFLVSVTGVDVTAPAIHSTWLEEKTEYLVVKLKENLQQNKNYQLHAVFTGELADDLAGFYRSAYTEGTATKLLATTQMQAADARKAFPCFDEPAMKANFSITLIHLPHYKALSNMPIKSAKQVTMPGGEIWTQTEFHPTLKMSTYLLGFIVSEFENVSAIKNNILAVNKNVNLPSTVKIIMDRWTLQMGFPVLTVDTSTGIISQKHFLLDPESPVERPSPFKFGRSSFSFSSLIQSVTQRFSSPFELQQFQAHNPEGRLLPSACPSPALH